MTPIPSTNEHDTTSFDPTSLVFVDSSEEGTNTTEDSTTGAQVELKKPLLMSKEKWDKTVEMVKALQSQVTQETPPPGMDPVLWKAIQEKRQKALKLLTPQGKSFGVVGGQRTVGIWEYNQALRLIAQADQAERPNLEKSRSDANAIAEHALEATREKLQKLQERSTQIPQEMTALEATRAQLEQTRLGIEDRGLQIDAERVRLSQELQNANTRLYGEERVVANTQETPGAEAITAKSPGSETLFDKKSTELKKAINDVQPKDMAEWEKEYGAEYAGGSVQSSNTAEQVAGKYDQLNTLYLKKKQKIRFFRQGRYDKHIVKVQEIRDKALSTVAIEATYKGDVANLEKTQQSVAKNQADMEQNSRDAQANQTEIDRIGVQRQALEAEQRSVATQVQEEQDRVVKLQSFLGQTTT